MYPVQTTWGDVWRYGYVQDKAGVVWKITDEKAGWLKLQNRDGQEAIRERPTPETPVVAMLSTEQEAFAAIYRAFPGAQIIDIRETGATT